MSHANDENENILLAYLRDELDTQQEKALAERLRSEPALREELALLETIKARFLVDDFDARESQLFARLQQQMHNADQIPHRVDKPSLRQRMIDWFRSHALVLEGALALVVIAQAATLASYLHAPHPTTPATPMYRGTDVDCLSLRVRFQAGVTEQQITRWLGRHDASIHAGPDRQGRYRIALPSRAALGGLLSDPDTTTLTSLLAPPPGCTLPAESESGAP